MSRQFIKSFQAIDLKGAEAVHALLEKIEQYRAENPDCKIISVSHSVAVLLNVKAATALVVFEELK